MALETAQLVLIVGYFSLIFAIVLGFLFFRHRADRKQAAAEEARHQELQANVNRGAVNDGANANAGAGARGRALARMRIRPAGGAVVAAAAAPQPVAPVLPAAPALAPQVAGPDAPDDDVPLDELDEKHMTKAQKKAREKELKKRERAEQRATEHAQRQEKSRKEDARSEARRRKEEERERKEREEEARAAKAKADEEKKLEAEYAEWKGAITVEDGGSVQELDDAQSQGILERFIEHIQKSKVVELDALASEFGLRTTSEVVDRIKTLEQTGCLTGVFDERGKFIFITPEEFSKVAAFINKRGRVSIQEIVAESNRLISLASAS
jgi:flagellar biosynthesis GTPase FlhF